MFKLYCLIFTINIFSSAIFAQSRVPELRQLNQVLAQEYDNYTDINYVHFIPNRGDGPVSANNIQTIEIYSNLISDTDAIPKQINFIKRIYQDDSRLNSHTTLNLLVVGNTNENLSVDDNMRQIVNSFDDFNPEVRYENIPSELLRNQQILTTQIKTKSNRRPSNAITSNRYFWSLVRFVALTGGISYSLIVTKDVEPAVALTLGMIPGAMSGTLNALSGPYGRWLTNGKWSTALIDGDNPVSRSLRSQLNIESRTLGERILQHKNEILSNYPETTLRELEEIAADMAQRDFMTNMNRRQNVIAKLSKFEEYLKWLLVDIVFAYTATVIPQDILGVMSRGTTAGIINAIEVGTQGALAQGFGDVAITVRKYQKIEELKTNILNGTASYPNQQQLLNEIEQVLARTSSIDGNSHFVLQGIEQWARSRSTALSILSVTTMVLRSSQIALATPMLISIGVGGGFYFATVQNILRINERLLAPVKSAYENVANRIPRFQRLITRYCTHPYNLRH